MNGSAARVARRRQSTHARVLLRDVLVLSKRRTRFELVCWELNVDQRLAWPAWELALKHGLLQTAGVDAVTGKMMFTLTERGRLALRTVGRRRA